MFVNSLYTIVLWNGNPCSREDIIAYRPNIPEPFSWEYSISEAWTKQLIKRLVRNFIAAHFDLKQRNGK